MQLGVFICAVYTAFGFVIVESRFIHHFLFACLFSIQTYRTVFPLSVFNWDQQLLHRNGLSCRKANIHKKNIHMYIHMYLYYLIVKRRKFIKRRKLLKKFDTFC